MFSLNQSFTVQVRLQVPIGRMEAASLYHSFPPNIRILLLGKEFLQDKSIVIFLIEIFLYSFQDQEKDMMLVEQQHFL